MGPVSSDSDGWMAVLLEGAPTLAVWPKVALAALGCVDDHGAGTTAAVPVQPVGLVHAPVGPFLGVSAESRGEKTQEDECYGGAWGFFSLNQFLMYVESNCDMCEECWCEAPAICLIPDSLITANEDGGAAPKSSEALATAGAA